jgi:hypothetical protein
MSQALCKTSQAVPPLFSPGPLPTRAQGSIRRLRGYSRDPVFLKAIVHFSDLLRTPTIAPRRVRPRRRGRPPDYDPGVVRLSTRSRRC